MKIFLISEEQTLRMLNEYTDRQSAAFDKWYEKIGGQDKYEQEKLKDLFYKLINRLPKNKRDIFQYKSISDVWNVLKDTQENIPTSKQIKMASEGVDYDTIYENEDVKIIVPVTHAGSCKHGIDTKWCTAIKNFPIYFKTHVNIGFLYRIIYQNRFINRDYKKGGEKVTKKMNEKYSLYIDNKGVQKLINVEDKPVDFEDLPFFTDEMERAIVSHFDENFNKIENNDILQQWLEL